MTCFERLALIDILRKKHKHWFTSSMRNSKLIHMDKWVNKCAATAFMDSCSLPPPQRATSVARTLHSHRFITPWTTNQCPINDHLQVREDDDGRSEIQIKGPEKKVKFLIWDIWVDVRTSSTGLVLKTAVANSAIWPLTWVSWSLNGGLWIPTPVRAFTSLRSPASAPLDPSITLAQCMHQGILGGE